MKKVTEFGKELRKRRIDRGETLYDMSNAINVTSAYLSALENGRKKISGSLFNKLIAHLELNSADTKKLRRMAEEAVPSVKISLINADKNARSVAAMFARSFNEIEAEKMANLKKYLEKILNQRVVQKSNERHRD